MCNNLETKPCKLFISFQTQVKIMEFLKKSYKLYIYQQHIYVLRYTYNSVETKACKLFNIYKHNVKEKFAMLIIINKYIFCRNSKIRLLRPLNIKHLAY